MHIYGKLTRMHLPYKSVTGRHTYVIYLMFTNIHAYLGFIQFIKFSVWSAERGKIEADVRLLLAAKRSLASCKKQAWLEKVSRATTQLEAGPVLAPPSLSPRRRLVPDKS